MGYTYSMLILANSLAPIYSAGEKHNIRRTESFIRESKISCNFSTSFTSFEESLSLHRGKIAMGLFNFGAVLLGKELSGCIESGSTFPQSLASDTGHRFSFSCEINSVASSSSILLTCEDDIIWKFVYDASRGVTVDERSDKGMCQIFAHHFVGGSFLDKVSGSVMVFLSNSIENGCPELMGLEVCRLNLDTLFRPIWKSKRYFK